MKMTQQLHRFTFPLAIALAQLATADVTFTSGVQNYNLVTTARTWDLAEADAVAKGGHLVRINDAAENTAVFNAISAQVTTTAPDGGEAAYAWIGGREAIEGTFEWVGSPSVTFWAGGVSGGVVGGLYQNFGRWLIQFGGPGEPDDFQGTQNRVGMAATSWPYGQPSEWNDINGTNTLYYVIEWTPWQFWQQANFTGADLTNSAVSGPAANPDGDGLANLLEHAFGTNPKIAQAAPVSYVGNTITPGAPVTRFVSGTASAMFVRRKNFAAEGLSYTVRFSPNLTSWTDSADPPNVLADNGTLQVVSINYPAGARFFRVRVGMP